MSDLHIHVHPDSATLAAIQQLKDIITMNNLEAVNALSGVITTLQKIGTESAATLQKVSDLQTIIDSMGNDVSPELAAAVAAVVAQVKAVDDLVPDA